MQSDTKIRILLIVCKCYEPPLCTIQWFYSSVSLWHITPPNFYQHISYWTCLYIYQFLACGTCFFFFILVFWIEWKKLRTKGQGQVRTNIECVLQKAFPFCCHQGCCQHRSTLQNMDNTQPDQDFHMPPYSSDGFKLHFCVMGCSSLWGYLHPPPLGWILRSALQ